MCPIYVSGLIGPGDRKSIQPMAERLAAGDYDQLHHFIAAGIWDAKPVETELLVQADKLVGVPYWSSTTQRYLRRAQSCPGEAIQIKASKKVAFRAAKDLKMAV